MLQTLIIRIQRQTIGIKIKFFCWLEYINIIRDYLNHFNHLLWEFSFLSILDFGWSLGNIGGVKNRISRHSSTREGKITFFIHNDISRIIYICYVSTKDYQSFSLSEFLFQPPLCLMFNWTLILQKKLKNWIFSKIFFTFTSISSIFFRFYGTKVPF